MYLVRAVLIGSRKVKITVIAGNSRLIPAVLHGILHQILGEIAVLMLSVCEIHLMDGVVIGDHVDMVVRDTLGNIPAACGNLEHPGFVLIAELIAASAGITELLDQGAGNLHGLPGGTGTLCHQTAQTIADSHILGLFLADLTGTAGVGNHCHTPFIYKTVRKGDTALTAEVRPLIGIGLLHLGNHTLGIRKADGLAGLMTDTGNLVDLDHTVIVIFVMGYQYISCGRGILADDNGAAAASVPGRGIFIIKCHVNESPFGCLRQIRYAF